MKLLFSLIILSFAMNSMLLFDFTEKCDISNWKIVDDGVMGGISSSTFFVDKSGNGIFRGSVSLENNGGFCSVRYFFNPISLKNQKTFSIRLKGDGKKYQLRVKTKVSDYYSYIYEFQTTTDWQTVEIPISEMYASFRGRTLNLPNYDGDSLAEMAFLIGNKKEEDFQLLIDKIEVK
jgi:hypothetical protein